MKFSKLYLFLMIIGLGVTAARASLQSATLTTLLSCDSTNTGVFPYVPPVLGPDGSLYGTTAFGFAPKGTNHMAVIYKITPDGSNIDLYTMNPTNGVGIAAPLIFGVDGNLYGVATAGGSNNLGTIFEVSTNGAFTNLYSFGHTLNTSGFSVDGSSPYGGLTQGRDGTFYGTTFAGGISNLGTVFQFSPQGGLTTLASFTGDNGAHPEETPLVEGNDGFFYGTTYQGGATNFGVVFLITAGGSITDLHQFSGPDGHGAYNGLTFGPDGILYGTTTQGGSKNEGTVYRITTGGDFTNLFSFNGTTGDEPESGVTINSQNVLFGTTFLGGAKNLGSIFQLTTNGVFTSLYSFSNSLVGENPAAGVILGTGETLYGTTLNGGINTGRGTVYELQFVAPPNLTITSPRPNQHWSNSVLQVSGTTGGDLAVTNVFCSTDGLNWVPGTTLNNWASWSNAVPVSTGGTNTLLAYAVDSSGNFSATNSVKFDYTVTTTLTILTNGQGKISPDLSGKNLVPGTVYTIKAIPDKGFGFYFWNVGAAMSNNATLKFTMVSNLVITANFKDTAAPTIKITAPKSNAKESNATVNVTGTAADNVGVDSVFAQVNSNGWMTATGTTSWSVDLPVTSGNNFIQAYAMDAAGNVSKTSTLKFTGVVPPAWAPVSIDGFTILVTPAGGDPINVSLDAITFSQSDLLVTNDSGIGTYAYTQTATNLAELSLTNSQPLNFSNSLPANIQLLYTELKAGVFTNEADASINGTFTIIPATNFIPKSWSGQTVTATNASHTSTTVLKFTSKTAVTINTTSSGTYTVIEASPEAALLVIADTTSGNTIYVQLTFDTKTGGHFEVNTFDNLGQMAEPADLGTFTFK